MKIKSLSVYPVKSCRGVSKELLNIVDTGFEFDRQFMIIKSDGTFITQRRYPKLAQIEINIEDECISFFADGDKLKLTLRQEGEELDTIIWEDTLKSIDQGDEIANWLSSFLEIDCRLVSTSKDHPREVKEKYKEFGLESINFVDRLPFLLVTSASLSDLNNKMGITIPIDRFRANIVIENDVPWEEDSWKKIRIGNIYFNVVKSCVRCAIPTIDQSTGERMGAEPLKTLRTFRNSSKGVEFGRLLIQENTGNLNLNDEVEIIEIY